MKIYRMLFVVTFGLITSFDVIADDYTCLQYIQAAIYKESKIFCSTDAATSRRQEAYNRIYAVYSKQSVCKNYAENYEFQYRCGNNTPQNLIFMIADWNIIANSKQWVYKILVSNTNLVNSSEVIPGATFRKISKPSTDILPQNCSNFSNLEGDYTYVNLAAASAFGVESKRANVPDFYIMRDDSTRVGLITADSKIDEEYYKNIPAVWESVVGNTLLGLGIAATGVVLGTAAVYVGAAIGVTIGGFASAGAAFTAWAGPGALIGAGAGALIGVGAAYWPAVRGIFQGAKDVMFVGSTTMPSVNTAAFSLAQQWAESFTVGVSCNNWAISDPKSENNCTLYTNIVIDTGENFYYLATNPYKSLAPSKTYYGIKDGCKNEMSPLINSREYN